MIRVFPIAAKTNAREVRCMNKTRLAINLAGYASIVIPLYFYDKFQEDMTGWEAYFYTVPILIILGTAWRVALYLERRR